MPRLACLILLALALQGARRHSATLFWVDALNPAGAVYNVYRLNGACTDPLPFIKLVSLTARTYQDKTTLAGKVYCYRVTATSGGAAESAPSNPVSAIIPLR